MSRTFREFDSVSPVVFERVDMYPGVDTIVKVHYVIAGSKRQSLHEMNLGNRPTYATLHFIEFPEKAQKTARKLSQLHDFLEFDLYYGKGFVVQTSFLGDKVA